MKRTTALPRRMAENLAMGALIGAARCVVRAGNVQRVMGASNRIANQLIWSSPFRENHDTVARARALAYRWSDFVPDATCLHRAVATRIWLGAFRIESRIVVGFRKRDSFTGHAWLEFPADGANTVLFHEDPDDYVIAMIG